MKQRFSSLDIKVIADELSQTLPTLRLANIHDLSSRIFLLKFARPGGIRHHLLVDSGFRCHLTAYARTTAAAPSSFVSRLRKFLRTRRVTAVRQIGTDRILEVEFSEGLYRLFLEFYAGGNVVLTDGGLNVLAVLRVVNAGPEGERVRVGSAYRLEGRQNVGGVPALSRGRVREGLEAFVAREKQVSEPGGAQKKKKKMRRGKGGDTLRRALTAAMAEFPPMFLDHALRSVGFDVELTPEEVLQDERLVEEVVEALQGAEREVGGIMAAGAERKGYIIGSPKKRDEDAAASLEVEEEKRNPQKPNEHVMYNDFHPFRPKQASEDPSQTILEFTGFNRTVDEFFSSLEGQKLESRLQEKQDSAKRKIEHAQQDHARRLGGLQQVQEMNTRKAQAIEANLERVAEATAAMNGLISQGMDWEEIQKLIEVEKKRGNAVAEIIRLPLKLHENAMTLTLGEWDTLDDEDEGGDVTESEASSSSSEDEDADPAAKTRPAERDANLPREDKRLAVDIDLSLSAWSNARDYYDQKKSAALKEEKTLQSSNRAMKSQRAKIDADLRRSLKQEKQDVLRPVRQPFWFEKFIWFLSSEGYLVVGGRDAQQQEILYRRHLKEGDSFVHADLDGAVPLIVKNKMDEAPIPPTTLSQAGQHCVSSSTAWDSKAVMSAWWVSGADVTKKASTGDYLRPGKFEIRADKNFLPPAQLLLGLAVLFQVTEGSKARHMKHRLHDDQIAAQTVAAERAGARVGSNDEPEADGNAENDDAAGSGDGCEEGAEENAHSSDRARSESDSEAEDEKDDVDEDGEAPTANPLQTNGVNERSQHEHDASPAKNHHEDDAAQVISSDSASSADEAPDRPSTDKTSRPQGTTSQNPSDPTKQPQPPKPTLPIRGKKLKRKKQATKYADQDPEDRAQAMALLGSAGGVEKARDEAVAREARQQELEAQRQRRREQHMKAQSREEEREKRRMAEGGGGADEEEEGDSGQTLVDLDALVGTPLPGDEILEAVAVCAPWSALGRYKYKAKLQPGTTKKGKAVREVIGRWAADGQDRKKVDVAGEDVEKVWPREVELIKGWKEAEIFGVVPVGKMRVVIGGGGGKGAGGGGGGKPAKKGGKGGKGGGKSSKKK